VKRRLAPLLCATLLALATSASAGVKDPIEGDAFEALVAAQGVEVQQLLERICAEEVDDGSGYLVTGPMDPFYDGKARETFHALRVIVADHTTADRVLSGLEAGSYASKTARYRANASRAHPTGFRGITLRVAYGGHERVALIMTVNENRWLIWVRDLHANGIVDIESEHLREYARAVSDYLYSLRDDPSREGDVGACPEAPEFGLTPEASFYAPRPPYVIQGYTQYKDFLHAHENIDTPFARGVIAFVPGDSLREAMARFPPERAWPNKEEPVIQHEYREFFSRGGRTGVLRVLDGADAIGGLKPGEYFYCVGVSGKIRFGYETPREEVARIEEETGREVPRANHAFLFPGEPVLTAGAFFVRDGRIVEVNAHSGHYFYSNVTATVREDIAERSDEYVLTLGHFLAALERLGVDTRGILVSKM
jgi:hypothetical protein